MKKARKAQVVQGYGTRSNADRLAAYIRRRQFRTEVPGTQFPILIFKPE